MPGRVRLPGRVSGRAVGLAAAVVGIGLAVVVLSGNQANTTPPIPLPHRVFGGVVAAASAAWSTLRPRSGTVVGLVTIVGLACWQLGFAPSLVYLAVFTMYQALAHSDMKPGVAMALSLVALTSPRALAGVDVLAGPAATAWGVDRRSAALELATETLVDVSLVCILVWVAAGQLRAERVAHRAVSALRAAEQAGLIAAERRRIAAELHDVAGHHLATMAVETKVALRLGDIDSLRSAAESVAGGAVESLNAMRRLAHLLYQAGSAPLEPAGTLQELDSLCRTVQSAGLEVRLRSPSDWPVIDAVVDGACYRIVQEALTNVMKHSEATSADVEITIENESELVVRVSNAAGGADQPARLVDDWCDGEAPEWSGHGLIGMQERARSSGGSFRAGRADGRWLVECRMPVGRR